MLQWLPDLVQWGRFLVERWLVVPAGRVLPAALAMRVADLAAAVDVALPTETRRVALGEIRAATGQSGIRGLVLAWKRLAAPRRELVYLARMSAGRERLADWRVIERRAEGVRDLIADRQPFVIATGHFSSAALNVVQQVLPGPAAFVAGAATEAASSPAERRRQLGDRSRDAGRDGLLGSQYSTRDLWIRVPDVWGPGAEWDDGAQRVAAGMQILSVLQSGSGIVLVRVDAVWGAASGIVRPFAGLTERPFALGAMRVARLAQCPVVPVIAVMGRTPRTVLVEWGDPIPPPARADAEADCSTLDRVLAHIEQAIGRYPTQYLAHVGWHRRWQPQSRTWEAW